MVGQQADLALPLLLLHTLLRSAMSVRTAAAEDNQDGPKHPEPPQLVVVGAAARLPAAVSCLTQIPPVGVCTGTVPWSPQQGQAATGVVLHGPPLSPLRPDGLHAPHPEPSNFCLVFWFVYS